MALEHKRHKTGQGRLCFFYFFMWGGSSLGYKKAGFKVLGNVEIDPKVNDLYITNCKPQYNFCEDLREFNKREDLPAELYDLDILDGSPPCTSFSMAGVRDRDWQKKKKFKEGQATQTLDDLFFIFLDTVEKLKPKIMVAENVKGIIQGKAKGYVNEIIKRFHELGYGVQIFLLNAATMDVPQARERVFFIANRCGYKPLDLKFSGRPIPFREVKSESGKPVTSEQMRILLEQAGPNDTKMSQVLQRISGENKFFTQYIIHDNQVAPTITSGGDYYRKCDRTKLNDEDYRHLQSFPEDYNFKKVSPQYVTGMSVPPNMMAHIALEIYRQWLKK